MKKASRQSTRKKSPLICKGNLTKIDPAAPKQLHGAYLYQAITAPNPAKSSSPLDIPEDQVIEAKAFVDQNHK